MNDRQEERNNLVRDWNRKRIALATAKRDEMAARLALVRFYHGGNTVDAKGTENHSLGEGYGIKIVFGQNATVPSANNGAQVRAVCDQLANLGEEGRFIAEKLFRWKPELSASEYDKLTPYYKRIVNEVVTTSPATPAVEFIEPGN